MAGLIVKKQTQIFCQCEEGRCFLEEDAAWMARNGALASDQNDPFKERELFLQLDVERLRNKEAWMERLQVQGTFQVRCRRRLVGGLCD